MIAPHVAGALHAAQAASRSGVEAGALAAPEPLMPRDSRLASVH
jgi:hypothetical protein